MTITQYIELTSTNRNRTLYPEQSNFVVDSVRPINTTSQSAYDPVARSTPALVFSYIQVGAVTTGNAFGGGSPSLPILNALDTSVDDNYNGLVITDDALGESRTIIDYRASNNTVTLSSPFGGTWAGGDTYTISNNYSDGTNTIFLPDGIFASNEYVNMIITDDVTKIQRTITAYDALTRVATIDPPFAVEPAAGIQITVRHEYPSFVADEIIAPGTGTAISGNPAVLGLPADGAFNGMYIYSRSLKEGRLILSYLQTGGTSGGSLYNISSPFSALPGIVDILPFSYDNATPLSQFITPQRHGVICYDIELVNIIIPNIPLRTGSRIAYQPYVYVELSNEGSVGCSSHHTIISNNPNASRALFRVPVDDISNPLDTTFIKLGGRGMVQTIKLNMTSAFRIRITLPDGSPFEFETRDVTSPAEPNKYIQISALFAIREHKH
jgi:hypothetical protein